MLRRLLIHTSNYAVANVLVTLAGLISFPIFTRLFDVSQYGLLNLVSATLGIMVGVGKLGLQTSVVRFYAEASAGRAAFSEQTYVSTALLGMLATGTFAASALLLISEVLPASFWNDARMRDLLILTSVLVLVRVLDSCLINMLRAQERSGVYAVYLVARRYGGLSIVLFVLFNLMSGLQGFYAGTIAAEVFSLAVLVAIVLKGRRIRFADFSPTLMRALLAFALPMALYELGSMLVAQGDRYVIQSLLGSDALGVYAAAYNFSEYAQSALLFPFGMAMAPMLSRAWETQGAAATSRFIETALHFYVLAATAVLFGMAAMGADALELLASSKYMAGATILPWVMAGMVMDGANSMLGAGLYLRKKTVTVMLLVVCAAVVNIALNFLLVPLHGIMGSAFATLMTYAGLTTGVAVCSRRYLPVRPPWMLIVKAVVCGAAMYFAVVEIHHDVLVVSIALKLIVAGLTYGSLVLLCDDRARGAAMSLRQRVLGAR